MRYDVAGNPPTRNKKDNENNDAKIDFGENSPVSGSRAAKLIEEASAKAAKSEEKKREREKELESQKRASAPKDRRPLRCGSSIAPVSAWAIRALDFQTTAP